jgi:hypothetical protein
MSKKQKTQKVVEPLIENDFKEVVVETPPVVEQPKVVVKEKPLPTPKKNTWEIKDRTYFLTNNQNPLSYAIKSSNIYFFDEEKGYERELKYTSNQKTPFVDEFPDGSQARLEHIIFRNGSMHVPRNKQTLQKLLSLYHPQRDTLFVEKKPVVEAANHIDWLEMEIDALNIARDMDINDAEGILRVEIGSKVSKLSSKELRRDLMLYARKNPRGFIALASDDNVQLRNFGIKAVENGFINLSGDQRTFTWASTARKLMTIPFDENPYSALAAWFKTDEGMEVYKTVDKRMQ